MLYGHICGVCIIVVFRYRYRTIATIRAAIAANYSYITFAVPATNVSAAFVTDSCTRSNTPDKVILPAQNVLKFGHGENCPVHTHVLLPICDSVICTVASLANG